MVTELMKITGRKFAWAYAALFSIWSLCMLKGITGAEFQLCFGTLAGVVMAANYGENREKARAASAKEVKPDAPTPPPLSIP